MIRFRKITAIEPVSMSSAAEKELRGLADEVILYQDIPINDDEIIRRIGNADGVLLSYTSHINEYILKQCPDIRYIGMCCSLYSEDSANVDIRYARSVGITVKGIRDYGDRGVVEYVLCELTRRLHGFDRPLWKDFPIEFTGLKAGIIGMGVSGTMIAEALQFMGADVSYFSRSRKLEAEEKGIHYLSLSELLKTSDVVCTCLNKNVILLKEEEFKQLGSHKILFNTSIGPSFESEALAAWLLNRENIFCCDTEGALGERFAELSAYPNVCVAGVSAGRTRQAMQLLNEKVLFNIRTYLV